MQLRVFQLRGRQAHRLDLLGKQEALSMAAPEVFLSYSSRDRDLAERLARDLSKQGIPVFLEQDSLEPGHRWEEQIRNALERAEAMVVLLTPASLDSQWVTMEWRVGLESSSRRVIPVLAGGVGFEQIPLELGDLQWIHLGDDYRAGVAAIADAVRVAPSLPDPTPAELVDVDALANAVTELVARRLGIEETRKSPDPTVDDELVFVIISFDSEMDPIFEAIESAATSTKLRAERVKDVPGDYRITDKILFLIRSSRFVVADLTRERPNVYFELGYARGIGKPVVTIVRRGTEVHFDVQDWTYIEYVDSRPLEEDLRKRFEYELGEASS